MSNTIESVVQWAKENRNSYNITDIEFESELRNKITHVVNHKVRVENDDWKGAQGTCDFERPFDEYGNPSHWK